jgi:predicted membrane protein
MKLTTMVYGLGFRVKLIFTVLYRPPFSKVLFIVSFI